MNFLKLQQWIGSSKSSARLLASETFETGSPAAWWTEATPTAANYTPNTAEALVQSTVKHSGSYAGNYYILPATGDEQSPIKFELNGASCYAKLGTLYEIFIDWWEYYKTGYPWPAGSQKLSRFGYIDGNEPGTPVGDNTEDWFTDHIISTNNTYVGFTFYEPGASGPGTTESNYNTAVAMPADTWINWGVHIKLASTPGGSDGIFKLYKDGAEYLGASGLNLGPTRRPVNTFWIGGNYTNLGSAPASVGNRYIDDIKVYTGYPY